MLIVLFIDFKFVLDALLLLDLRRHTWVPVRKQNPPNSQRIKYAPMGHKLPAASSERHKSLPRPLRWREVNARPCEHQQMQKAGQQSTG